MGRSKQVNEATASPAEPVVSEVGAGEDARKVILADGWELTAWTGRGDTEPRIRDLDLAKRLGYANLFKIRDLIKSMLAQEKLSNVAVFPSRGKTSGGRPGKEYWLTEAQALKVAAKSETEPADALLDEMIHVFQLAKSGLLPSQKPGVSAEQLEAMLGRAAKAGAASALAEVAMADLPAVRPGDEHRLGRGIGTNASKIYILEPLCEIARLKARAIANDRDASAFQSILKIADTELRRVLGHSTFLKWEQLPIALLDEAANALSRMRVDAENLARRSGFVRDASGQWVRSQANAKQLELSVDPGGRRRRRRRRMFDDATVRATDRVLFGVDRDPSKEPN